MKRFILDTGIAADCLNKRHGVFERTRLERSQGNLVGITVPLLAEIVFGIEKSKSRDENMRRLIAALPHFKLWPFDRQAAFEYGSLCAELQRLGRPIGVIDTMTAAIARSLGNTTIVSKDSDLQAVPGLIVENWTE